MAFEQEPPERPRESREALCGSATLHRAAAFLAEVSVDHRPCDISHQIAPQTLSQGPATLPQAGTSPHSWCLHHFKTFQFLCPHCVLGIRIYINSVISRNRNIDDIHLKMPTLPSLEEK